MLLYKTDTPKHFKSFNSWSQHSPVRLDNYLHNLEITCHVVGGCLPVNVTEDHDNIAKGVFLACGNHQSCF